MLSVFKDLDFTGNKKVLDGFIDSISAVKVAKWERWYEGEKRIESMALSDDDRFIVFKRTSHKGIPDVSLFLTYLKERLVVTNIVPEEGELTKAQYNEIIDDFVKSVVSENIAFFDVLMTVTKGELPITHWLSQDTAALLDRFSKTANKSTGSSHPLDLQRWNSFIIAAHREKSNLDSTTLERWFVQEEGWGIDAATSLAIEYEFARGLLSLYDQSGSDD
ncbi:conserved hypothetical protein [Magnetococcus marinus MC-1]|uniref:Uncharacterized protein n=1 Tax=Magnetococcus marinus (strain ATCC BAA-1437 / JCM 17883 / MC-1) TaxID=156889 RepID=A0L6U1_MAGMM|nr:hypothetical protein [Magnetococcus marinus]ABK43684.1 conserved hypothetical protein [Magnetococcus marinus MC-1]